MGFPTKDFPLLLALLSAVPSLLSQLSSRLKTAPVGSRNTPNAFNAFVTLLPHSPRRRGGCLVLHAGLGHQPSHVPTTEPAAPSGGNPASRPCFSWGKKKNKIKDANSFICLPPTRLGGVLLGTPAGKALWHRLAFTEGGMRSRGEPSNQHGKGSAGAALPAHNTAVCTAAIFIHTAGSYIYLECHRSLKSAG